MSETANTRGYAPAELTTLPPAQPPIQALTEKPAQTSQPDYRLLLLAAFYALGAVVLLGHVGGGILLIVLRIVAGAATADQVEAAAGKAFNTLPRAVQWGIVGLLIFYMLYAIAKWALKVIP